MKGFLLRWVANALALYVAAEVIRIPGIFFQEWTTDFFPQIIFPTWSSILLAAFFLGMANALVRPIVMLFTCLINFFTLGLFTFVINGAILWLISLVMEQVIGVGFLAGGTDGFLAAFLTALVVSAVNFVLTKIML
ncbi:MAG: phage holin family protein [Chloroflexi bacterium]|nr:phage holin family protein [Chloroflexota bacterium]